MTRSPQIAEFERSARFIAARLEHQIGRFSYASDYHNTRHATCARCGKVLFYDSSVVRPTLYTDSYALELCPGTRAKTAR
jgi:hypothetical protein